MLYEGKLVLTLVEESNGLEYLQRQQSVQNINDTIAFTYWDMNKMLPA